MGEWAPCELEVRGTDEAVQSFLAALRSQDSPISSAGLVGLAAAHGVRVSGWHNHAPPSFAALLTEALAVTDPERPPEGAVMSFGLVTLDWGGNEVFVELERKDGAFHCSCGHAEGLDTSDPAEARAWLAAALADAS